MRVKLSGPRCLAVSALAITLLCALSASAVTENILHSFTPYPNGSSVNPGLVADAAGNLYGTTYDGGLYGVGTVFKLTPNSHGGWTETVLYNFDYNYNTGTGSRGPQGGLIFDHAGNLYGTFGGLSPFGTFGTGGVFELSPSGNTWTFSVLYTFTGGADGSGPSGNLIFDAAGNLYGEANQGGELNDCYKHGCGTVFKLAPSNGSWTFSVIYTFPGSPNVGGYPVGGLILDQAGNLYGVNSDEDPIYGCTGGCGTVFELTPSGNSWTASLLYQFTGKTDGNYPQGPLIFDSAGNLFGTTTGVGLKGPCGQGCGVVFELKPNGTTWTESPIYKFTGRSDGGYPTGRLALDAAGNLYGAAEEFTSSQCGTVFKLAPSASGWTQSVLHAFKGANDGCGPTSVLLGSNGVILGTVVVKGPGGMGLVFELTPANGSWKKSTPAPFLGTDGSVPSSGLISDSSGNLYGETQSGGTAGIGVNL